MSMATHRSSQKFLAATAFLGAFGIALALFIFLPSKSFNHRAPAATIVSSFAHSETIPVSVDPEALGALEIAKRDPSTSWLWQDPRNSVRFSKKVITFGVESFHFSHLFNGHEVLGGELTIHKGPSGTQVILQSQPIELPSEAPQLTATEAVKAALHSTLDELREPQLKILPPMGTSAARWIYVTDTLPPSPESPVFRIVIDANSGQLLVRASTRRN